MAIACVLPERCSDIINMYKDGKHTEAKALQMRLIGSTIVVTSRYGIPGLKAAMDLFGYHGGSSRMPLLPISDTATKDIKNIFTKCGFFMKKILLMTTIIWNGGTSGQEGYCEASPNPMVGALNCEEWKGGRKGVS